MLADPTVAGAGRQLRRASGCSCATSATSSRTPTCFPTSTTTCGRRSSAKPSCSSRASCARTASVLDLLTADYTFVNERLARHYGIPNVYGSQFRRVTVDRRRAARSARAGQHPGGDVARRADVAGRARQVDSRKHPRRAGAAAAARRAAAEGERGRREAAHDARADGGASRQSGVRDLPQGDGSDRLRARELRRGRRVAHRRRRERRSTRPASWRTAPRSTASSRCGTALLQQPEVFVRTMTEKLLTYALGRGLDVARHAGGARHRARAPRGTTTGSRRSCSASSRSTAVSDADDTTGRQL